MYILVCVLLLVPLQAFGASLVISTEPHREEIERVKYYTIAYGFRQASSGAFQLYTNVRYRNISSRIQHSEHFMFPIERGTIIQRDPKTLVLRLENRELVVGRHRWWYAPYWQAADNVRITCDHDKQFKTLVIENCRLIIEAAQIDNAFLRP